MGVIVNNFSPFINCFQFHLCYGASCWKYDRGSPNFNNVNANGLHFLTFLVSYATTSFLGPSYHIFLVFTEKVKEEAPYVDLQHPGLGRLILLLILFCGVQTIIKKLTVGDPVAALTAMCRALLDSFSNVSMKFVELSHYGSTTVFCTNVRS